MKLGDFGIFVIFAAIYAAGTLGLPQISFMAFQIRIGEMPSAFVALFGLPAVFGLTLGQFIANLGLESKPVAFLSPAFSFLGLLVIYYVRKRSTLLGCVSYIVITGLWLSVMLPIARPGISSGEAAVSAFGGQFISVMIGYAVFLAASRSIKPAQTSTSHHA
jgi:uncharacterized membrane protein